MDRLTISFRSKDTAKNVSMFKVFHKHGLISLNPLDEKFDPNLHEALFQQVRSAYFAYRFVTVTGDIFCFHRKSKVKNQGQW